MPASVISRMSARSPRRLPAQSIARRSETTWTTFAVSAARRPFRVRVLAPFSIPSQDWCERSKPSAGQSTADRLDQIGVDFDRSLVLGRVGIGIQDIDLIREPEDADLLLGGGFERGGHDACR